MDEKTKSRAAIIGGAILFFIEAGLQVSGITNPPLAIVLWGTAVVLFLYWLSHFPWLRRIWTQRMILLTSWYFIIPCAVVALLAVGLAAYGFGVRASQVVVKEVIRTVTVPAQTTEPVKVAPNIIPLPPEKNADRIARYIQLMELLPEANATKGELESSGGAVSALSTAQPDPSVQGDRTQIRLAVARQRWDKAVEKLSAINGKAFIGRKINLDGVADPVDLGIPAPGEDRLGGDGERIKQYRTFYYLAKSVLQEADRLISEMAKEEVQLKDAIKNTPLEKKAQ
jgi:hypothetical protein